VQTYAFLSCVWTYLFRWICLPTCLKWLDQFARLLAHFCIVWPGKELLNQLYFSRQGWGSFANGWVYPHLCACTVLCVYEQGNSKSSEQIRNTFSKSIACVIPWWQAAAGLILYALSVRTHTISDIKFDSITVYHYGKGKVVSGRFRLQQLHC